MIEINIQNIVASTIFAEKLDLNLIAQTCMESEYEPEQFPGLVYRLHQPKTATLLFRSGKANCTGASNIEDVRKSIELIAEKLRKIGVDVHQNKNLQITIQNIVATANLDGNLTLHEVAIGLGLDNVEYEPEQFPGLIYRVREPKIVILLFSSGKIVCTGGRTKKDISIAVEDLFELLTSLDLFH